MTAKTNPIDYEVAIDAAQQVLEDARAGLAKHEHARRRSMTRYDGLIAEDRAAIAVAEKALAEAQLQPAVDLVNESRERLRALVGRLTHEIHNPALRHDIADERETCRDALGQWLDPVPDMLPCPDVNRAYDRLTDTTARQRRQIRSVFQPFGLDGPDGAPLVAVADGERVKLVPDVEHPSYDADAYTPTPFVIPQPAPGLGRWAVPE